MRDVHNLQTINATPTITDRALNHGAIFLAAVSFVVVLMATYGLDLSAGFF